MNEKLEPCPFCGSEAGIPTNLDGTPVDYEITDCCCKNDDCPLADYWTPIKIWQTRPTEDALRKRIAELTECIGSQMADVYTLKARVAELSQTVGLITTLKPTMVMDVDHPLDMAKEVVEHVTVRIAELEELVDELVDSGDNLFDSLNPIAWKHEWIDKWWKLSNRIRKEREE